MKNNKVIAAGVIALVLLIALGVWALSAQKAAAPQDESAVTSDASQTSELSELDETATPTENTSGVTITYTDSGFDKDSYTVKSGTAVTLVNNSSRILEFSSGEHPTHTENTELNLSSLNAGEKTTFTPTKTGNWHIHNHLDANETANLVVE